MDDDKKIKEVLQGEALIKKLGLPATSEAQVFRDGTIHVKNPDGSHRKVDPRTPEGQALLASIGARAQRVEHIDVQVVQYRANEIVRIMRDHSTLSFDPTTASAFGALYVRGMMMAGVPVHHIASTITPLIDLELKSQAVLSDGSEAGASAPSSGADGDAEDPDQGGGDDEAAERVAKAELEAMRKAMLDPEK